eukprot:gb/GECH01013765.1/.p1 GENE.gb/GECH01013765.1/~~gb/GECH01013765.1/.p1  ORF type:complete len:453 (+),score=108.02 gb/GECH01013765.1/:1-1359(+)
MLKRTQHISSSCYTSSSVKKFNKAPSISKTTRSITFKPLLSTLVSTHQNTRNVTPNYQTPSFSQPSLAINKSLVNLTRSPIIIKNNFAAYSTVTPTRKATFLINKGVDLFSQGQFNESLSKLASAIDTITEGKEESSLDTPSKKLLANCYNNMGEALRLLGRREATIPERSGKFSGDTLYKRSLELYIGIFGEEKPSPSVATVKNNYGLFLLNVEQKAKEALPMLQAALEMRRALYKEKNQGQYEESQVDDAAQQEEQEQAITIDTTKFSDYDLATTYNNVGLCLAELRQFSDAMDHYVKSKQIHESKDDKHPALYSNLLSNIGLCLFNMGESEKARRYLKRGIDTVGEDSKDAVAILNNLAMCEYKESDYEKAYELWRRSLDLMGQEHAGVPMVKANLAASLEKLGRKSEAKRELNEANELLSERKGLLKDNKVKLRGKFIERMMGKKKKK